MKRDQLRDFLYQHIPLTQAMGIEVTEASMTRVLLSVPLAPNSNHHSTAFGGSIATAGILACWSLAHLRLETLDTPTNLVIYKNKTVYREPVTTDFQALCSFTNENTWADTQAMLDRWGKAKLQLTANLLCQDQEAAQLYGSFVITKKGQ